MQQNKTTATDNLKNIAIVGSGPTALYLLKNIENNIGVFKNVIQKITIYEKDDMLGLGMPYNPKTTDIYNLANISSEEIPVLMESFGDWLRKQDKAFLHELNIKTLPIDDSEVYSRISLGHYFEKQFKLIIESLKNAGIEVFEKVSCEVLDIISGDEQSFTVVDCKNNEQEFSAVVIANGHEWKEKDRPESGYFASPWPIQKLIPKNNQVYNFPVGTLGASLSAFDVVTSLSHRHGIFEKTNGKLTFKKNKENPDFKIILHSAEGWLPHLQYEQQEPIREIYRHFNRTQLLNLIDKNGFLRIENYFNILCRPALVNAFEKSSLNDIAEKLENKDFSFKDFVKLMSDNHQYVDSFEGMRKELIPARRSVENKIPIYWMETLDDLMYSLNYHAELLPAEDHLFFLHEIMPFLMNVIAALPLSSAEILLALHDSDSIELKTGMVNVTDDSFKNGRTTIAINSKNGKNEEISYLLFINCGGGKKLNAEDYPFKSLVKKGILRAATADFINIEDLKEEIDKTKIIETKDLVKLKLSGIDIDASYKTINKNGKENFGLFDINFNHTNGLRPYSYGLQACNATSLILVESWLSDIMDSVEISDDIEVITKLYQNTEEL